MGNNHTKTAFTLVEMLVVISVIAVLGTISYISFSGYNSTSRDSARLTDMNNLATLFEQSIAKNYTLPKPGTSIDIKAGSTIIGYQGYADKSVQDVISLSSAKDPLDGVYYTYSTNADLTKFQIIGFFENSESSDYSAYHKAVQGVSVTPLAYAEPASYEKRFIVSKGNQLGVYLLPTTLLPIQTTYNASTFTSLDIANTTNTYVSILNSSPTGRISGNGAVLYQTSPVSSCKRIFESGIGKSSGEYQIVTGNTTYRTYCIKEFTDKFTMIESQNGDAELGNNQYWTGNPSIQTGDVHSGNYAFKTTGSTMLTSTYYFPIDIKRKYRIEGWFKSIGTNKSRLYFGYQPYDKNFTWISNPSINAHPGTETELYASISPSDTVIKLVDKGSTCTNIGNTGYVPLFSCCASIAFNADDSGNLADLPNYDLSPSSGFASIVDNGSYCTLTTKSPVGKTYPAGTKIRIHGAGGTFSYCAASYEEVPTTWKKYEVTLTGEELYNESSTKFWRGTKYIQFLLLTNYAQDTNSTLLFDDLKITQL